MVFTVGDVVVAGDVHLFAAGVEFDVEQARAAGGKEVLAAVVELQHRLQFGGGVDPGPGHYVSGGFFLDGRRLLEYLHKHQLVRVDAGFTVVGEGQQVAH